MTTARLPKFAILATVTAVSALSLTACGSTTDAITPATDAAASTAADPREVLLNAVPGEKVKAYAFKVKGNVTPLSGVVDAPAKGAEINIAEPVEDTGIKLKMDLRIVDQQGWVKIAFSPAGTAGLPKFPKKWMLLDPAKLDDKTFLEPADQTDPGYTQLLVENAAGVKQTAPGHFTGTTDLTKSTEAEILEEATLKALGTAAAKVPFEAVVDGAGHLTSVVVKIPAAGKVKAHNYTVSYTGFDSTPPLTAPAADEQQKATAAAYEFLNS
jgi:hypothetical protein